MCVECDGETCGPSETKSPGRRTKCVIASPHVYFVENQRLRLYTTKQKSTLGGLYVDHKTLFVISTRKNSFSFFRTKFIS